MTDDEIQQAIRDAELYASQDATKREHITLCAEAQKLYAEVYQALSTSQKHVDKKDKKQIKSNLDSLNKAIPKNPGEMSEEALTLLRERVAAVRDSQALL
jgi:molecular chaperone DnaK